MRVKRSTFRFMGFVALADTLFAVSAGLLLLNPVHLRDEAPPPPPKEDPSASALELARSVESELVRIERSLQVLHESDSVLREIQASKSLQSDQ